MVLLHRRIPKRIRLKPDILILCVSFLFLLITAFGCEPPLFIHHPVEEGNSYYIWATWYGDDYRGKTTASGEVYSPDSYTCAISGFPFGTILEVENTITHKKVAVRVTDRPGKDVIDLTPAAFQAIGTTGEGRIPVKILVIGLYGDNQLLTQNDEAISFYTIQIGAYSQFESAKKEAEKFISQKAYIYTAQGETELYHVRIGSFPDQAAANNYVSKNLPGRQVLIIHVSH